MNEFDVYDGANSNTSRTAGFQFAGTGGTSVKIQDPSQPVGASAFSGPFGRTSPVAGTADLYVIEINPAAGTMGYYEFTNGTPVSSLADATFSTTIVSNPPVVRCSSTASRPSPSTSPA